MLLLKLNAEQIEGIEIYKFTIHNASIKTVALENNMECIALFTIHNASIKT